MPVPNSEHRTSQETHDANWAKYKQQSEKGYELDLAEIRHTIATAPSGPDYYIEGTEGGRCSIFVDMTTLLYLSCCLGTPAEKWVNQSVRRQQQAKERGRCSHRNTRMRKLRDRKRAAEVERRRVEVLYMQSTWCTLIPALAALALALALHLPSNLST